MSAMNPTSSVKIYEVRNTTYQLAEELLFRIPPSVIAMNPLETYFIAHLEVSGQKHLQYCLNKQIGAEALVRELTIMNGSESAVLEQITSYNRLKRVLAFYHNNKTEDNLNQLMSGGQPAAPVLATNVLFNKTGGTVTQKKVEVMFKLSLSGIFSSTKPFPTMLSDGLVIKIQLARNINNVLQLMGERQLSRNYESKDAISNRKDYYTRVPGTHHTMAYQVSFFGTSAAANDGTQANTEIHLNTKGVNTTENTIAHDDNDSFKVGNFQCHPSPTAINHPFTVGMTIAIAKNDFTSSVNVEITSVSVSADGRIVLGFASEDTTNGASNDGAGKITSKVWFYEEGQDASGLTGQQEAGSLTISNLHLVLGTLQLPPQQLKKLQAAAGSKGGFNYDYESWTDYGVNITKALVNSAYIPCKLNRTKSILSFYEHVGGVIDGSRDNLLPITDTDTAPSQYNYKIDNLIVPNRVVSLSNYNRETNVVGRWGGVHIGELEKAIEASGVKVNSLEDVAQCLTIGRQLAIYGHTYDMSSAKGETRLELNFTTQNRDLLIHNFVKHIRRCIITPQATMVEM